MQAAHCNVLPSVVELSRGAWRVQVCAELGGALAGVWWQGRPVLRERVDEAIVQRNVRRMACYPLVPYSNRIGYGRFECNGESHTLRANFAGEPHALHGFGWQSAWRIDRCAHDHAVLSLEHDADADWPYACSVEQQIAIRPHGIQLALTLINRESRPAPAGLGWHPYFPLTPHTRLQTAWRNVLLSGADRLPNEVAPVPDTWRFDEGRPLADLLVDHCFTGWSGEATIDESAYRLRIATVGTPVAILFRPPGESFFAFEPVSHSNDALHFAGRAGTVPMRMLEAGGKISVAMALTADAR